MAPPSPATPGSGKAKPPPPAPRKTRSESMTSEQSQADAEKKRAETQIKEQALKEQQVAMAEQTKEMEYVVFIPQKHLTLQMLTLVLTGTKKLDKSRTCRSSERSKKRICAHWRSR